VVPPAISDEQVIGALKVVVKGSGPTLDALTETDPFGLKKRTHRRSQLAVPELGKVGLKDRAVRKAVTSFYAAEFPGTAAWERMTPQQRTSWWMNGVGRFTTLIVAVPGFGGAIADRLPLQDALGGAGQAILLCAMAREWGVTDPTEQVRMLAWVLCRRTVSRELVLATASRSDAQLKADGISPELEKVHSKSRSSLVGAGRALWRYGRVMRSIVGELQMRPHGRWAHRMIGKLPVVGVAGDYLGERSALRRAVRQADEWVRAEQRSMG